MGQTSVFYFAFTNSHKPYGDNYSSKAEREDTAMDDTIGTSYSSRSWPTRDTELIIIIPTTTTPH